MDWFKDAGNAGDTVNVTVLRKGQPAAIKNITPNYAVGGGAAKAIGVQLDGREIAQPIVAGRVKDSPADIAKFPAGSQIVSIDGHRTAAWGDVDAELKQIAPAQPFTVEASVNGKNQSFAFGPLSESQTAELHQNRYFAEAPQGQELAFHDYTVSRKTTNPLIAAQWGVGEIARCDRPGLPDRSAHDRRFGQLQERHRPAGNPGCRLWVCQQKPFLVDLVFC